MHGAKTARDGLLVAYLVLSECELGRAGMLAGTQRPP
jgi:hypothetical protein